MRESRRTAAWITAALLALTLAAGCSERMAPRMAMAKKEVSAAGEASPADRHLAYEHTVGVDVPEGEIAKVSGAVQATCRELAAEGCELLNSSLNTGRYSHASLKFRVSPAGVHKLISSLGQLGEIVDQSTTAEDLARPLADTARKVAMLTDYRAKLEALRHQARLDADTLIKLTHELAQVQADLEAAQGEQAFLRKRVDLEILHVQIHPLRAGSFWRPIREAGADFGSNLSQGIASAVVGVAYLLPWGLLLGLLIWAGRALWKRRRRVPSAPAAG
jgi:hypothetical protein